MKRENKTTIGKSMLKLLMYMAIGGVIGFVGALGLTVSQDGMRSAAEALYRSYAVHAWIFQIVIFAVTALTALFGCRKAAGLVKAGGDENWDRAERWQGIAMTVNEIGVIIQFFLFGMSMDENNTKRLLCIALFVAFCASAMLITTYLVKQIQAINPMKRGDVGSWNFGRQWLESCDEAERMTIYRSSYKSFTVMKYMLPMLELAALLGKLFFDTGNLPIILVTLIWAVNTGVYCYYSVTVRSPQ